MPSKKKAQKQMSIKETKELLAMLKLLAKKGHDIWEDKEINMEDIVHVVDLAKSSDMLVDGVKGVDQVAKELQDLDKDELVKIVLEVYSIAEVFSD